MRVSSRIMAENIKSYLARPKHRPDRNADPDCHRKKINSLSDAPGDIGKVLDYRTTLSKIEQYQENITDAKTRVEYTETVLGQINGLVNDAQTIASNPDTENREGPCPAGRQYPGSDCGTGQYQIRGQLSFSRGPDRHPSLRRHHRCL